MSGGETGPVDDAVRESLASRGATVMGRRMFSGGEGPWEDDPNADGWWGDDPRSVTRSSSSPTTPESR